MQFKAGVVAAFIASAHAFPAMSAVKEEIDNELDYRKLPKPNPVEVGQPNSGFFPNTGFDATEQYVDVGPGSGHEFRAPKKTDRRGPCPGLNAAANHQFFSDSTGVLSLDDTRSGLAAALGFSPDFSIPLFFFSVFNSGSLIDQRWSIGGPFKTTTLGVLGSGLGISNSHNQYEGDSSPGRNDAYLHNGDGHSLNIPNFRNMYEDPNAEGNYDMDSLRRQCVRAHRFTKYHNPYGFFGPTFFVSPIAHQFVVAMMSNHSAKHVQGVLTPKIMKSFFSVKEHKDGRLEWIPGHDRIPNNWYRRPSANQYGIVASFGDFGITVAQYPEIGEVGGNLGKAGDFVGLDFADFTGGAFNAADLTKGNNAACFALQAFVFVVPGLASKLEGAVTGFLGKASKALGKTSSKLGCKQTAKMDESALRKYPGYTKKQPLQPATPF